MKRYAHILHTPSRRVVRVIELSTFDAFEELFGLDALDTFLAQGSCTIHTDMGPYIVVDAGEAIRQFLSRNYIMPVTIL